LNFYVLRLLSALAICIGFGFQPLANAQDSTITVASTTSTEQSGLFKHLLPIFKQQSGVTVNVVALGTGQALDLGRRGDADVVFVHDPEAEKIFVSQGFGAGRRDVMYNDFVLLGPNDDPAKARGRDIVNGLTAIQRAGATFVSRADKSGTHAAELRAWKMAALEPQTNKPAWYKETGSGMGPALNTAAGLNAYILADRSTWLAFKNRQKLGIVVQADARLFNPYGVMLVNPQRHPHVKAAAGQVFIDWLVSVTGQKAIADYKIGGEQLFFPLANRGIK
jgi:tungstate transport system substrate-binding protein